MDRCWPLSAPPQSSSDSSPERVRPPRLVFRVVSGPLADRTGRYWTLTMVGYAMTAVCVPLLAVTPLLGGAGLAAAACLILAERVGKAVRSPAKSTLLADAAGQVGHGPRPRRAQGSRPDRGLRRSLARRRGDRRERSDLAGSAGPGRSGCRRHGAARGHATPDAGAGARRSHSGASGAATTSRGREVRPGGAAGVVRAVRHRAAAACTAGLVTFGLISFHLVREDLVATVAVPLLYAGAMAAAAVAALATGEAYDRFGPRVLLALPPLVAAVPALAFRARSPRSSPACCCGARPSASRTPR